MHSVLVYLVGVTKSEAAAYFSANSQTGLREHWYFPNRADPVLSIRFPHAGSEFRDAETRASVVQVVGREPDLTIQFDVGGKHPGHRELREYLIDMLDEYSGVAVDDLSPHVWTLDELKADLRIAGFAFADHEAFRKAQTTGHVPRPAPHGTHEH